MDNSTIDTVFSILKADVKPLREPIVSKVARTSDAFQVLVSTMLSLRTKDAVTEEASGRLFALAPTPEQMVRTPLDRIEKAIFPVGFYKTKARNIRDVSRILIDTYGGRVPDDMDRLLSLPGVGRKTANLVIILAFGGLGICVDTHVHRITNRWGYVKTKTPDETEMRLREKLPVQYWTVINDYLVPYGQFVCVPISPFCSRCRLFDFCRRTGVKKSR
ncbi:MAG: Endonuclease III [Deltaproteobacteria bacterium ADurb.BinA179]|jgi:endonuclease-3|nr:endonuclease III [Deltaproteobacteria bacterium]NLW66873.1 endonuclease III [Bacteriovoracaceae bacterium]OPZ27005.1 MAG: Endonuclease III [Deltaproteobacteria bacterium ADurb.BinA179]HRR69013.1 endonuclease III [Desulfomonilia bacterium]HNR50013.1 endonuclease III [Deltaproteobacteria bacterium]